MIRLLTREDAQDFWDLRLEALATVPRAFASSEQEHRNMSLSETGERLRPQDNGNFVLGAFDGKTLIGTIGFFRETREKTAHKGMIWGVYVTAPHRGKGIGNGLLAAAIERLRTYSGLRQVNLTVAADQAAAVALYRRHGFTEFGLERAALKAGGGYVDERWMTLRLSD